MLLRFIDQISDSSQENLKIALELEEQEEQKVVSCQTAYKLPSISQNFRSSLSWYFARYPQEGGSEGDSDMVGRLITIGQGMGKRLAEKNEGFDNLKKILEEKGLNELRIQIESSRIEFHQECWEFLILPNSKYILSSAVKGFFRQFDSSQPPLPPQTHQLSSSEPLTILHLISRPTGIGNSSSQGVNNSVQAVRFEGACRYELFLKKGFGALYQRFGKNQNSIHILHYDGPIEIIQDIPYLLLETDEGNSEAVSVTDLATLLIANQVTLLTIEARQYVFNGKVIPADLGLAHVAQAAMSRGLGNILGLSNITNPWIASQCFETVYERLLAGFSVEQAVVEARKNLQGVVETPLFSGKPKPFHIWSLLTHYSNQSVQFFASPVNAVDLYQSGAYQTIRQTLFGFRPELLPPQSVNCIENTILSVLKVCQPGALIYLSGQTGSGKTQLNHQVGFYLLQQEHVKFSFYFDYDNVFYTLTDILQMIAPVVEVPNDQFEEIKAAIHTKTCYFVFDNFDRSHYQSSDIAKDQMAELIGFIESLKSENHIVLMTGKPGESNLDSGQEISLEPMLPIEQKVLAADVLRRFQLEDKDQDPSFAQLLTAIQSSPFLTQKVLPRLADQSIEDLTKTINNLFADPQPESAPLAFYEWQFNDLPEVWQRLLLVFLDIPDVLLEMIGIVCNQEKPFPAVEEFFGLLGDPKAEFSKGLETLDRAGFLQSYPHGKVVNAYCFSFLRPKLAENAFLQEHQEQLHLLLSQIICEGLRLIIPHLQRQQNPSIQYNLLMNRQRWVTHLERLWFAEKYLGFMQTKRALTMLMQQEKLGKEMSEWSLDLLKRSEVQSLLKLQEKREEAPFACLFVVQDALGADKSETESTIIEIARITQNWLDSLDIDKDPDSIPLFNYVVRFLEIFYRKRSEWQALQEISERAYIQYQKQEAWPMVIQSLSALAQSHFELGETEQGLERERQLLEDLPFDKLPPGSKIQLMKEVMVARDVRGDTHNTQKLLNAYQQMPEAEHDKAFINNVQAEIYLKDQKFEAAAQLYYQLFQEIPEPKDQNPFTQHLESKLQYLKEQLGKEAYQNICDKFDQIQEGR